MEYRDHYRELLTTILNYGCAQKNARTGQEILTLPGGWYFSVPLSKGLPVIDCRFTRPKTAAAEVAWFLSGEQSTEWLNKHTGIWKAFEEDIPRSGRVFIGKKNTVGRGVKAAYGHRWQHSFGINQLVVGLENLAKDPTTRRVWISTWDPAQDLPMEGQKNTPCPVGFNLYLVGDHLFSSYVLRSSDVFMGLPYDVMNHSLLMAVFAATLSQATRKAIKPGGISFTLGHAHLYANHVEMAEECLNQERPAQFQPMELPDFFNVLNILEHPDNYVAYVEDAARNKTDWPVYNPKPQLAV